MMSNEKYVEPTSIEYAPNDMLDREIDPTNPFDLCLIDDIEDHGVKRPLVVAELGANKFHLLSGFRRLGAVHYLHSQGKGDKCKLIPVVVNHV